MSRRHHLSPPPHPRQKIGFTVESGQTKSLQVCFAPDRAEKRKRSLRDPVKAKVGVFHLRKNPKFTMQAVPFHWFKRLQNHLIIVGKQNFSSDEKYEVESISTSMMTSFFFLAENQHRENRHLRKDINTRAHVGLNSNFNLLFAPEFLLAFVSQKIRHALCPLHLF